MAKMDKPDALGDWIKQNLMATVTFLFVILSFVGSQVFSYSTLKSKVSQVEEDIDKYETNIEKQIDMEKRISSLEGSSLIKLKRIDNLDRDVDNLSQQSQDFKAQSMVVNQAVVTLNGTLDKMNNTLSLAQLA